MAESYDVANLLLAFATMYTGAQVQEAVRRAAFTITFCVPFMALGVASAAIYWLRGRNRDPIVIWFGLFAFSFGARILILSSVFRFATGLPDRFCLYLASAITYTLPLALLMFLRELFPTWRPVLWRLVRVQIAFAALGLVCDQLFQRSESLRLVNNVWVLLGALALVAALYRQSGSVSTVRELRFGALAFILTVVLNNLSSLNVFPFPIELEPLGFAVFLVALGRAILVRAYEREERLMALDQELKVARQIQQSILPASIPELHGVAIAARYLPMTSVAGDFYEFLRLDDHRLGILVADVSGHGVPAALIASMVKVAIAAQLPHADDPALVLSGMNQTLCGNLRGQFVTAAYLFVDLQTHTMRYGAAGHPPLLWLRTGNTVVESVEENGLPLGMMASAQYACVENPFSGKNRLLLYTDGLVDATNGSEAIFGDEQVQKLLLAYEAGDADDFADSLLSDLKRWAGYGPDRGQEDDLTIVVVDLDG